MPKVSIIIPVYNVEKYLRQCLDSVVNQTLKDIEIICVDDGSPDKCGEIIDNYAAKDPRIVVIHKENGGLGNARNVALNYVTSDYIMYLDSDDWLELNACEAAYNQISKNNNDFAYFNFYNVMSNGEKSSNSYVFDVFLKQPDTNNINLKNIKEPFISMWPCWYKIYSTKFIKENNLLFLDGKNFEGRKFYAQAIILSNSVSVIDVPLYNYRVGRKGAISTNAKNYEDYVYAVDDVYKYVKKFGKKNILNGYLVHHINNYIYWYNVYSNADKSIEKDFYLKIHNNFKLLSKKHDISEIIRHIEYSTFVDIVKCDNYSQYAIKKFINNIFSIRRDKQHEIITILGIKIKLKK